MTVILFLRPNTLYVYVYTGNSTVQIELMNELVTY